MTKTLLSAAFLMLVALAPAYAQEGIRDTSVPPEEQADGGGYGGGAGQAAGQTSSVFLRGGPINLRAGGFVDHSMEPAAVDPATAAALYQEPKKTSAAAYNAGLMQARAARQQQSNSVIPSPFPPGFGE